MPSIPQQPLQQSNQLNQPPQNLPSGNALNYQSQNNFGFMYRGGIPQLTGMSGFGQERDTTSYHPNPYHQTDFQQSF